MLAFCIPLSFVVRSLAYDRAIDTAELEARTLAAELATADNEAAIVKLARQANSAAVNTASVYLASGHTASGLSQVAAPLPPGVRAGRGATTVAAGGSRLVWEPVRGHGAAQAVVVRVSAGQLTRGVAWTWVLLFGGGALLVVIAVALADRLGASIVRPLLALVTVTNRLRDGDLDSRGVPSGPYEVAEVGQAVNELADRINALLANARLAAADLGHRLRTPLTALRLDVEAMGDAADKQRLQHDLDTLEEAVSRLIQETRQAPPGAAARADLAEAVRDRMAFWSVLAKSQGRAFDVQAPSRRVEVGLGRDELDAAIDALLSNVFTHTPEGTGFSVQLRRTARGAQSWSLVVEDQGTADSTQPAKPGSEHRGTGLGLDIVRRTAARAGGNAAVGRTPGGGFRVEVQIPDNAARTAAPTLGSGDEPSETEGEHGNQAKT
jgi:signal transduction histidine kinase